MKEMQHNDFLVINKKTVYNGFFKVISCLLKHRLFEGGWSQPLRREIICRSPVVGVLPYDPEQQKIIMIEQFRPGVILGNDNPWLLEVVAGYIEAGESKEVVAHRELKEETGLVAKTLHPICDYWVSPGGSTGHVSLFYASVDSNKAQGIQGLKSEHEDIRLRPMTLEEAMSAVTSGRINNGMAIIALQWLQLALQNNSLPLLNTQ